jgi:hypothetical protein
MAKKVEGNEDVYLHRSIHLLLVSILENDDIFEAVEYICEREGLSEGEKVALQFILNSNPEDIAQVIRNSSQLSSEIGKFFVSVAQVMEQYRAEKAEESDF